MSDPINDGGLHPVRLWHIVKIHWRPTKLCKGDEVSEYVTANNIDQVLAYLEPDRSNPLIEIRAIVCEVPVIADLAARKKEAQP